MKREILLAGNAVKSRAFLCNQFVLLLHLRNGSKVVVVPNHTNKGIEKGTYYNILRQAGISK